MNITTVLFIVIILVLLYLVIRYFFKSTNTLTSSIMAGTTQQTISASKLGSISSGANSSNFTYSIWFYIDDWNYQYDKNKVLLGRLANPGSFVSNNNAVAARMGPCPLVMFGAIDNNLLVYQTVYASDTTDPSNMNGPVNNTKIHQFTINNIPIQVWTNLVVSVYGRTMDMYLNGKLVNTCIMPGTAYVDSTTDLLVTPNGGFSGWTSKLEYYSYSIDPQTAWNIYTSGYGGSMFSNYNIKVAFTENGNEASSFML